MFVLKESLVWSISILLYLGWQPCKDEGIFPLRTAAQTACSSLHVKCAQEGRFRSALPGLLRSRFCTGLVTDPLLSDTGRQEQVPGEHCLLLVEDYEQAIHLSQVVNAPASTFLFVTVSLKATATGV